MASQIRFRSVMHPESTGYILLGSYFDRPDRLQGCRAYEVASWVLRFDTLGDGFVQHAPEMPVLTSADTMTDVLASLAMLCQENPEALEIVAREWPSLDEISTSRVLKAAKIKYREDKRQYINTADLTVSTAESKRHDKRWIELYPMMDGIVHQVFCLCNINRSCLDGIGIYAQYAAILDTLSEHGIIGYTTVGALRTEFKEDMSALLSTAFGALSALVKSQRSRAYADRAMACFTSNLANRARNELANSA